MKASDNPFPSLLLVEQPVAPVELPGAGQMRLYISNIDNNLYTEDSSGGVLIVSPGPIGATGPSGIQFVTVPAHFNSSGTTGQVSYDGSGNFYWCYLTDTWAQMGPGGYSNSF